MTDNDLDLEEEVARVFGMDDTHFELECAGAGIDPELSMGDAIQELVAFRMERKHGV